MLLAIANHLLCTGAWDREFVRRWVDWETFLRRAPGIMTDPLVVAALKDALSRVGK